MIGTQLGHYRIERLLGTGGMGEVYLADDAKLGRRVALKVLSSTLANDPDRRERFEREARAAAALNHPNIVTIHSVETIDGVPFITLELVDGETLADLIPAEGLPLDRVLTLGIPLADAVGAAHQRGITHRDLKPANVMVTDDTGTVKIMDFGIARVLGGEHFTHAGFMMGTPAYMAPEQVLGQDVDGRADLYSVGVLFYRLLSRELPFQADTAIHPPATTTVPTAAR